MSSDEKVYLKFACGDVVEYNDKKKALMAVYAAPENLDEFGRLKGESNLQKLGLKNRDPNVVWILGRLPEGVADRAMLRDKELKEILEDEEGEVKEETKSRYNRGDLRNKALPIVVMSEYVPKPVHCPEQIKVDPEEIQ